MNIFGLSRNPYHIPPLLIDNYVNRLLSEGTICLCNGLYWSGIDETIQYGIFKGGKNIWFTRWLSESPNNFHWLYNYLLALHLEFKYRFHKPHKCGLMIEGMPIECPKSYLHIIRGDFTLIEDVPMNDKMPYPYNLSGVTNVDNYLAYYIYKVATLLDRSRHNSHVRGIKFTSREIPKILKEVFKND